MGISFGEYLMVEDKSKPLALDFGCVVVRLNMFVRPAGQLRVVQSSGW